jgi:nitrogenase molybdenum-iron protein alpha chain
MSDSNKALKAMEQVLDLYPAKAMKNRKKHQLVNDHTDTTQEIQANTRTVPGIITNRGCCYAGCKGVVVGPIVDMVHITHGPIGCAYYTWGTRRNKGLPTATGKSFLPYSFSTDMQESDIVFGGEKKLMKAIDEAVEMFHPKAISICATCPVGLIGDDIGAVAKEAEEKHGIQVLHFNCEGYKGVSQSAGHHIANNRLMNEVIGRVDKEVPELSINILGEYNIGGDEWEVKRILSKIGYNVITTMTGNGKYEEMQSAHEATLNVVQCHRSINYIAEMLETKYGTPWLKVNFISPQATAQSLRDMAKFFDMPELTAKTEEVIAEEYEAIEAEMAQYKALCEGKTVMLFVGGSRAHHYQLLFQEIGMETLLAGYEFGHRDDYEGRRIINEIKLDADTRNIEEIEVEKDPEKYKLYLSPEKYEELKKVIPLGEYEGLMEASKDGTIIIDDLNHIETEEYIKALKPDLFGSGIKDKYTIQKMGVFSKQIHSYDYSGPYAGFKGAVNFGRDVAAGLFTPAWDYVTPPWNKEPLIEGKIEE